LFYSRIYNHPTFNVCIRQYPKRIACLASRQCRCGGAIIRPNDDFKDARRRRYRSPLPITVYREQWHSHCSCRECPNPSSEIQGGIRYPHNIGLPCDLCEVSAGCSGCASISVNTCEIFNCINFYRAACSAGAV